MLAKFGQFGQFEKLGQTLGKGGQGRIYDYTHGRVVKVLRKTACAYKELDLTLRVQDIPGVVKIHGYEEHGGKLWIIMDKYQKIEKIHDLKRYTRDIVKALHAIHQTGILHNDIKFDNIMMNDAGEHIIIDFGCASDDLSYKHTKIQGTPLFCSIESLRSSRCNKSDIWSLGVMLYRQMYKEYPFKGTTMGEVCREIFSKNLDFSSVSSGEAKDFLSRCLTRNLEERMTPIEALHHDWLCEPETL